VLGRDDVGRIAPGMSADIIAVRQDRLGMSGTERDPVAALVMVGPFAVDYSIIDGVPVIERGGFVSFDVGRAMGDHRATMRRIYGA
jgi:cytosine/adenosine deaminase-related metal-dependent hydrolase